MPANFQRLLPILLVVFVLLFILPTIFKKHSSSTQLSSKDLSQETIATASTVDSLQRRFFAAHHGYTDNVADLLSLDHGLGKALGDGVVVGLNVSGDKQTYYAQVASSVISLVRARAGKSVVAKGCTVVKNASGVDCPKPPAKTTTTGTTTTTTTTTGSTTTG